MLVIRMAYFIQNYQMLEKMIEKVHNFQQKVPYYWPMPGTK